MSLEEITALRNSMTVFILEEPEAFEVINDGE
jgi:hypothetical protein